jgi:hypothetical protein
MAVAINGSRILAFALRRGQQPPKNPFELRWMHPHKNVTVRNIVVALWQQRFMYAAPLNPYFSGLLGIVWVGMSLALSLIQILLKGHGIDSSNDAGKRSFY